MKKYLVALAVSMALVLNAGDEQISVDPTTRVTSQSMIITADFQVDSAASFFVDVSENKTGICNATPAYPLDVTGAINTTVSPKINTIDLIQTGATAPTGAISIFKGAIYIQDNADIYIGTSTDSSTGWVKVN